MEQQAVFLPALRLGLQAQANLSQARGFLILADLVVDLRDGVFDQSQTLDQRLLLLRVTWKKHAPFKQLPHRRTKGEEAALPLLLTKKHKRPDLSATFIDIYLPCSV